VRSLIGLKFLDLTWPSMFYSDYDDSLVEYGDGAPVVTVVSTYVVDVNLPEMVKFQREDGSFGSMDAVSFADYYSEVTS
jgi:hypothetical protein